MTKLIKSSNKLSTKFDARTLMENNQYSYIKNFIPEAIHEMDTSFIDLSFGQTMENLKNKGYFFFGYTEAPYRHMEQDYAIVFGDVDFRWCHISERMLNIWKAQVTEHEEEIF